MCVREGHSGGHEVSRGVPDDVAGVVASFATVQCLRTIVGAPREHGMPGRPVQVAGAQVALRAGA